MATRHFLLDTDVGIDDALMLMYLAAEPDAEIVAIGSSHGNCSAAQAARNTLKVLDVLGLDDVPVAVGAESPLAEVISAPHVHGQDGLGDADIPPSKRAPSGESAVDQILRLGRERPDELDLVAVGTMTNLGLALQRDPLALTRFRTVAILGGYSRAPRPGDPATVDANVYGSPDAADRLFASETPLVVVPVDTTNSVVFDPDQIERMRAATTPQGRLAWRILPFYFDFYATRLGVWTSRMHDPVVPAVLLDPTYVESEAHRPLVVEPFEDRHRALGRDDLPPDSTRRPARIVTKVAEKKLLDRLVDGLVLPLGALPSIGAIDTAP